MGAATGWSRDRFDPAENLVEFGNIDYICFECMSEVTMSAAQVNRLDNPSEAGYDPYLDKRLRPILRQCIEKKIKIITNQGWLDPSGAARKILEIAKELGIDKIKIVSIDGLSLIDSIQHEDLTFLENGRKASEFKGSIVSAEAYLGAKEIVQALQDGADVVITSRIADSSLYLGPLAFEFDWDFSDSNLIAKGITIGHLMECGAQVCGGYFADPGYKDVLGLSNLGHPICEVSEEKVIITKTDNTGGVVSEDTCKEQLLYEISDPSSYLCPDCIADFTGIKVRKESKDRVEISGFRGRERPPTLKVLVGVREGYITEEMILYAGPGAMNRAKLAEEILRERFKICKLKAQSIRMDYVGINSIHREATPDWLSQEPYEVILRISVRTNDIKEAQKLRYEVEPMAVNGPAGTGKWAPMGNRVRPIVGMFSTLICREAVPIVTQQFTL